MRLYRDWRISGDIAWLGRMWPSIKACLDYSMETWDPRRTGTLEEPHHNTYDIEFWGPDGMCSSIYLGALQAVVAMGLALGEDVGEFEQLLHCGRSRMETELFNGEYFHPEVRWGSLDAPDPLH